MDRRKLPGARRAGRYSPFGLSLLSRRSVTGGPEPYVVEFEGGGILNSRTSRQIPVVSHVDDDGRSDLRLALAWRGVQVPTSKANN
ncbi:hypothetical protein EVAR_52219_1 [Eumeta japonica]|uniref:Uncharacterized protein n=1 Tax=Eumeta variegata TaxID=151549 RepID=A0A4C1Z0A0_EUMVA|nr:hypothetical protein EVAR_52219_1 [Eumeta japonica]